MNTGFKEVQIPAFRIREIYRKEAKRFEKHEEGLTKWAQAKYQEEKDKYEEVKAEEKRASDEARAMQLQYYKDLKNWSEKSFYRGSKPTEPPYYWPSMASVWMIPRGYELDQLERLRRELDVMIDVANAAEYVTLTQEQFKRMRDHEMGVALNTWLQMAGIQ